LAQGRTASPIREARTLAFGLILGFGEDEYLPHQIAKIVNERFGLEVKSKTVSNWKSGLPAQMERYGITEGECREAVVRVLTGDLREREDIDERKPYTVLQGASQEALRELDTSPGRDGKPDTSSGREEASGRREEAPGTPPGHPKPFNPQIAPLRARNSRAHMYSND